MTASSISAARTVRAAGTERYQLSPTDTVLVHHAGGPGAIDVMEETFGHLEGPPLHVHHDSDSYDLVLEGRIRFQIGDEQIEVGPGDFVFTPRHTPHTFVNLSDAVARVINIHAPGGFSGFFAELTAATGDGPLDPAVVAPVAARHGAEVLGPPLAATVGTEA